MDKQQDGLFAVIVDVGGTHIRFGALNTRDAPLQCVEVYDCARFSQLDDALQHYQARLRTLGAAEGPPVFLCLALPGDVQSEPVELVNLHWRIDLTRLAQRFHCQVVTLNDFSAQAHAIPVFQAADLAWLRAADAPSTGLNRAIIGPGTGLGVSALLPGGQVVESEGGHISFAPQSGLQQQVLTALWTVFPRLSAERLISGPGLANLYRGLALIDGETQQLAPEQISQRALAGDARCLAAIRLFTEVFGSICGDLALVFGAKGGIYLSGGLLQGLGELFDEALFLEHFDNKGRYSDYCRRIPIARVLNPQPGLLGAVSYVRQSGPVNSSREREQT
ncbi:MAG: ROK family protein [Gammaproteobacteria bacterium]